MSIHTTLFRSKTIVVYSIIAMLLFNSNKCESAKPEPVHTRTTSLLWEISGNGLTKPSYLYGTIHLIDKKDFYVRPLIDSMLLSAEQAVFEIKLDDMQSMMGISNLIQLDSGETISTMLPPQDYAKLQLYFQDSLGLELSEYDNQKPFVLIQKITENFIKGEQESFELYFLLNCIKNQIPIFGLETVEQQMSFFDSIPYQEQLQWLLSGIDSASYNSNSFSQLITFYKQENLDSIAKYMNESSPELIKYQGLFLNNRNKAWIPEIEKMMKAKTSFIAVGAGHLAGENGLIELLRKQGYTVKPI